MCEYHVCKLRICRVESFEFTIFGQIQRGKAVQSVNIKRTEVPAIFENQACESLLPGRARSVKIAEANTLVKVKRSDNSVTYVRKVERLNTRGPVNVLRVVDDKILFEGKSYFVTLAICTEARNRGVAVGVAIAETKSFRRRYLHVARIRRKVIREIHRERVVAVCAGAILRIQKVEAVNDCIGTMSVARTLKGVEIVASFFDERKNIFIFSVLIVDTFAPFAHKLVVEHVQNVLR